MLAARRDRSQRDVAKAIVVRRTLAGRHEDHVRDLGERFARLIVAEHLHTDVAARLDAHRAAGHAVVLVSASLAVYLDAVAALLGVEHVLATELEVGRDGRLTGELLGANVRGAEKARRLDEWLGDTAATVYAYGDGHGDSELLARADHAVMIDGRGRIPASARI
jgi:phosphatidylglycerophosphatase C